MADQQKNDAPKVEDKNAPASTGVFVPKPEAAITPVGTEQNRKEAGTSTEAAAPEPVKTTEAPREEAPKEEPKSEEKSEDLQLGATGRSVHELQALLEQRVGVRLVRNGAFDAPTERLVKYFQSQNGLESTGVVDSKTLSALKGE